jgi:hypothetical protein
MILDMIARLPGLTEVDGSNSPLGRTRRTRLKGLESGTGPVVCCIDCSYYNVSGFIFIPWNYMSPSRLRLTRIIFLNLDDFGLKSSRSPFLQRLLPYLATVAFHISRSAPLPVGSRFADRLKVCRMPILPNADQMPLPNEPFFSILH